MNVLIVDDQRLSRARLIQLIDWQALGIRLAGEAANGREALEKIGDTEADLVVTDVRMPLMDGLQLVEQAREQYGDIGFIVTSGYDEFDYVRQSLRLTVSDYLLKPVNGEELNAALRLLIDRRKDETAKNAAILRNRQEQWLYYVVEDVFAGDPGLLEAEARDAGFATDGRRYTVVALSSDSGFSETAFIEQLPDDAVKIVIRTRGIWLAAAAMTAESADGFRLQACFAGLKPAVSTDDVRKLPLMIREALAPIASASDPETIAETLSNTHPQEIGSADIRKAVIEIKSYVDEHYHEALTLTELAKKLYISPGYFCSLFRQATGINFLEYVAGLRMNLAKQLLTADPNRRINEVAERCGYQDLKYFRKLFKRYHGLTPMKFKEEAQRVQTRDC